MNIIIYFQSPGGYMYSYKFRKIHRKTPVTATGLEPRTT